jgi:hypothetical protein
VPPPQPEPAPTGDVTVTEVMPPGPGAWPLLVAAGVAMLALAYWLTR